MERKRSVSIMLAVLLAGLLSAIVPARASDLRLATGATTGLKSDEPLLVAAPSTISAVIAMPGPPVPQWDDAGDESFVRQLLPKLLGRRPRGTLEVRLLTDLVDLHGREAVTRMLMEQPEFEHTWTAHLVDHLKTQRGEGHPRGQDPQCFDAPLGEVLGETGLATQPSQPLASFVAGAASPLAAYTRGFNMYDLISDAIKEDNLFAAYRGYLWTLTAHGVGSGMRTEEERQAELGTAFDDVFLHRNMACMSCHRGTYSTTGVGQRTHPLYRSLDLAMFDHTGEGEGSLVDNDDYQSYCSGCHGPNGTGASARGIRDLSPQQLKNNLLNPPSMSMPQFATIANDAERLEALAAALNGAFGAVKVGETARLHNGVFRADLFETEDGQPPTGTTALTPFGMHQSCAQLRLGAAWLGAQDTFFAGVHDDLDASVLAVDADFLSGYQGLQQHLPSLPAWDIANDIPGDIAFAYMVAAKIADNVWEQIIGERLTIANQFARNQAQMRLHRHLTESAFVGQGWSLKSLIVEIVTSRYFNRRPPRDTVLDSAYSVPAVIDPFDVTARPCVDVESDPSPQLDEPIFTTGVGGNDNGLDELAPEAMCGYNGMLHAVHRYAPFTLLSGAASAMDWPRPALMPGGAFPDLDLVTAIGQYVNDWEPGAKDIDFQALLAWDEQFGRCRPPALASDRVDWLNRLVASVDEYNALHAEQPLTLADVVLTLKDWLLQMPVIEGNEPDPGIDSLQILPIPTPEPVPQFDDLAFDIPSEPPSVGEFKAKPVIDASLSEATLLQTLFGLSLDSPVDSAMLAAEPGGEVSRLRLLCGVYLKSPQFMLAGMVDGNDLPEPRLRVCNDGPCSYAQMCEANRSALARIGHPTTCHADHVQKQLSLGGLTNKVVVHSSVDAARQTERGINVMQRSQTMVAPK